MKKYNLFKVLAITVLVACLLTLFIPGSYLGYSGEVIKGEVAGVGIWALFSNIGISFQYFNGIAIFLIAVAILYSVLNKVEAYNTFVEKTAGLFKNKKGMLVIITTIIFGILSAVVSEPLILIVFMPFICKIMSELKLDNKVILSSTIVAGIFGSMCNIYNHTLFELFQLSLNTLLLIKVMLLLASLAILLLFIAPRKETKKVEKVAPAKKKTVVAKKVTSSSTKKVENKKPVAKKASSAKKSSTKKTSKKGA